MTMFKWCNGMETQRSVDAAHHSTFVLYFNITPIGSGEPPVTGQTKVI